MDRRFYKSVAAGATETDSYTVPDGKILYLRTLGGSGCQLHDAHVAIKWDGEIIFVTHGDQIQENLECEFIGDGVKKLEIILLNDSAVQETIGAYWLGTLGKA